jgi:hypothetical protein
LSSGAGLASPSAESKSLSLSGSLGHARSPSGGGSGHQRTSSGGGGTSPGHTRSGSSEWQSAQSPQQALAAAAEREREKERQRNSLGSSKSLVRKEAIRVPMPDVVYGTAQLIDQWLNPIVRCLLHLLLPGSQDGKAVRVDEHGRFGAMIKLSAAYLHTAEHYVSLRLDILPLRALLLMRALS